MRPLAISLDQGEHPFSNAGLGLVAIFVVPTSRNADGVTYEAVFA